MVAKSYWAKHIKTIVRSIVAMPSEVFVNQMIKVRYLRVCFILMKTSQILLKMKIQLKHHSMNFLFKAYALVLGKWQNFKNAISDHPVLVKTVIIIRRNSCKLILPLLASIFLVSGLSADPNPKELPQGLANILAEHRIPINTLSLVVQEVNAKEPVLAINPRTLRQPASLAKLFTTFIALDYLGPGYQWQTKIFSSDSIIDGCLLYTSDAADE